MPMQKYLWAILLTAACAQAQSTTPGSSAPANDASQKPVVRNDDLFPPAKLDGKVSLVRGVLKRVDPIHDQFVVQAFGGGEIKVGFDGQTKFLSAASTSTASTPNASTPDALNIPAGSVISLDVVTEGGRLFAKSVRTGTVSPAEINGQVVGYDPTRSRLTLRDAANMKEFSLRINPSTSIVNQGHPISAQALATGMLVRAHFSAKENAASDVEVLAERGSTYTFEGRVIALDLRSRVVSLSNDSDQSLRELAFGSLDANSLKLLHEGAEVAIQAEFDGDVYNVRSVTAVRQNQ
jgi:hypothetical protein